MIYSAIHVIFLMQVFVPDKVLGSNCELNPDLRDFVTAPVQNDCKNESLIPNFIPYNDSEVEFLLWTRSNAGNDAYYKLDPFSLSSLESSPFNGSLKTYTLIHGYTDNGTKQWILDAKTEILELEDVNVFSLNFSALVARKGLELDYLSAVCNAYKIGNYSAFVFNWLSENTEMTLSNMHPVGHSLGAQIAGIMGQYIIDNKFGKLKRITGLDPAGPLFSPKEINDFRLEKDQADFVDIMHANGCSDPIVCQGIGEEIGHVDFHPNGGKLQAGCHISNSSCSHQRVTALYIESIKPIDKEFQSWPCESWEVYEGNNSCTTCGQGCLYMGFYVATNLTGSYYLTTNDKSPFARGDSQF